MRKTRNTFYILVILSLLIGCASTGFLMAKPKVTLLGPTYLPKHESAQIDVYMANRPTVEYLEFALISCADTNDKWNLEQITIKAREIGADGIIITGKVGSSFTSYSTYYGQWEEYGITAIAIKYK